MTFLAVDLSSLLLHRGLPAGLPAIWKFPWNDESCTQKFEIVKMVSVKGNTPAAFGSTHFIYIYIYIYLDIGRYLYYGFSNL